MPIDYNEISAKANGGTELISRAMEKYIEPELLAQAQIIPSRVRELDPEKIRILHCHDLVDDEAGQHLRNRGWQKFHKIVFVSNWQMQSFIKAYSIPWERCAVIQNAIEPFPQHEKPVTDPVRLIYHSTPHRGLDILEAVFREMCKHREDVVLDVYSSFNLYGWEERDKQFLPLYEKLKENPKVNYHGAVSNEKVRKALLKSHVFAYPSVWEETSCLCLIEAMAAGLVCVHPNYGALFETAANWTLQYQWIEDPNRHAQMFYNMLMVAVDNAKAMNPQMKMRLESQAAYTNALYDWQIRKLQWDGLITSLLDLPRAIEEPKQMFSYEVR